MDDDLDLESALSEALDAGKPQPEAIEAPEGETHEEQQERLYRRSGSKFEPVESKGPKDAKGASDPAAAAPKQPWKPLWYKDEYGEWDKLPEGLRDTLRARETESAQAITKHSTAAKAWEPVLKEFEPYQEALQQAGKTPQQYVGELIAADKFLRSDPAAAINWIAQQYLGADIYQVADWLYQQQYQPQQVDPRDQKLQALEQQIQQLTQRPQQERIAAVQEQIQAWAKDKPHFEDLRGYMHRLSELPDYAQATLDELYEAAMYAHPQLRQRTLTDQRKAELDRARAHSTGTRGGAFNGSAKTKPPKMSLEEEIAMHLDGGGTV